jgi:8-oxo-dGTP pyrophosphatase MutT (NUDIX family)
MRRDCIVPTADSLAGTIAAALAIVGEGAERRGGERQVPLHVWRTAAFRGWYAALRAAGHRLDGARLEWLCRSGPGRRWLFMWALRVEVHPGRGPQQAQRGGDRPAGRRGGRDAPGGCWRRRVVLVREFRSAVRNAQGMVLELPSGSSFDDSLAPLQVAAEEVHEETGLRVDAARLRAVGSRQVAATLLGHHAHVYSLALTDEEMAWLVAHEGVQRGSPRASARTCRSGGSMSCAAGTRSTGRRSA